MKSKLLKVLKFGAIVLLVALTAFVVRSEFDKSVIKNHVRNENLPTIKNDFAGTPVDEKNRFVNLEHPFLSKPLDLLKWQLSDNPQKQEKQNDTARLEVRDPAEFLQSERDGILWLGHAGFFIRLDGVSIIIDAVFGKPPIIKSFFDVHSPIDKIRRVDFILVSHDHRDHADEDSIKQLTRKFPEAKILAGLRMNDLLDGWKTPTNEMQTAGWYQQFATNEKVKIFFLPSRHWARRGLFDTNQRLWGAFGIQGAGKTIYFSGDSGYDTHFKDAGKLLTEIDYFIVGIGAYKPIWFMHPNHIEPADAVKAFVDAKARFLIPMHFGRFDLSDEPPSEPLRLLKEKMAKLDLSDKLRNLQIYESLSIE